MEKRLAHFQLGIIEGGKNMLLPNRNLTKLKVGDIFSDAVDVYTEPLCFIPSGPAAP